MQNNSHIVYLTIISGLCCLICTIIVSNLVADIIENKNRRKVFLKIYIPTTFDYRVEYRIFFVRIINKNSYMVLCYCVCMYSRNEYLTIFYNMLFNMFVNISCFIKYL